MTPHGPTLHDHPRHTLRQIVAAYGPDILRDVRRTRALLKDLCSAHQAEINLLVMALQANVPAELQATPPGVPYPLQMGRLVHRMQVSYFLPAAPARWAVAACAHALDLTSTSLTDDGLAHLAPLSALTTLDLEGTAITAEGLGQLASLSALRHLYLGNTAITDEGLAALAALPQLVTLDLAMCDHLTAAAIPHLAALPHLRALNVADTRLAGVDLASLSQNGLEIVR